MDTLTLRPSEIRYSKRCVETYFSDGIPLPRVFTDLISGSLKVTDLPKIEVYSVDNHWWWTVDGNRRLFLYRKLENAGVVETINVRKRLSTSEPFQRNFTTGWDGMKVFCRPDCLQSTLDDIVCDWKSGRNVMAIWGSFNQGSTAQFRHLHKSELGKDDLSDERQYDGKRHYGGIQYHGNQYQDADYKYGGYQDADFECDDDEPQYDDDGGRDFFKSRKPHGNRSRSRKVEKSSLRKEPKYKRKNVLYDGEDNYESDDSGY